MKPLVAAFAALACLSLAGQCASAASLHGLVTCEDGCHIDGAVLTLTGPQNYTTESVLGLYSFDNVTSGNYTLTVDREGYARWTGDVAVDGDVEKEVVLVEDNGTWWPWALFGGLAVVAVAMLAIAGLEVWRKRSG